MMMNDDKSPSDRSRNREDGHRPGGFGFICHFHFQGKLATSPYIFPSFHSIFFSCCFFLSWCEGAEVIQLSTCWFLAALFWSLGLMDLGVGWFCTLKAFVVQSVQEQRNDYDERLEMGNRSSFLWKSLTR